MYIFYAIRCKKFVKNKFRSLRLKYRVGVFYNIENNIVEIIMEVKFKIDI